MADKYKVIDRKDGTNMGTYGTKQGAERKREALDTEYGGYRYGVDKANKGIETAPKKRHG